MARIQTRKNISLRRNLHDRLQAWCKTNGKAKSRVIEELLADLPVTPEQQRRKRMRSEFQVHILNEAGIDKATQLGEIFSEALSKIEALVRPPGSEPDRERDRSLALVVTKLQEASFFAKRGIAVDPANQKVG